MISPLSITKAYILQPALLDKHQATLEGLSATKLWQQEVAFLQGIVDKYAAKFSTDGDKQQLFNFTQMLREYNTVSIPALAAKLQAHEQRLATMLQTKNESDVTYFAEHDALLAELQLFHSTFSRGRLALLGFLERAL